MAAPRGVGRFCELYQNWRQRLDVVLRQEHAAGEKRFVDFTSNTIVDALVHRVLSLLKQVRKELSDQRSAKGNADVSARQ